MKRILLLIALGLLNLPSAAETIHLARNLAQDGAVAQQQNKPIVFFVSANHCPYCTKLRNEYFKFSPNDERFILRELELDGNHATVDFDGRMVNHQALADRYHISLTPTVAFVKADGEMLTESIVGIVTMDYYHYYFEKSLADALGKLSDG